MTNDINARLATLLALREATTDPDEQAALDTAIAALQAQLQRLDFRSG
jgi:ribosome-associated translation inhibitor RaiA